MKLQGLLQKCSSWQRSAKPEEQMYVRFTGNPPVCRVEEMMVTAAGGKDAAVLSQFKERLADALYYEELCRGGWVSDIGIWGPAVFRREAARLLAETRPEFGYVAHAGTGGPPQGGAGGIPANRCNPYPLRLERVS